MAIVGAVYSVNGYTGHVVLTTSDLENTSDYQTSTDVAALISAHNTSEEAHPYIQALISSKQDPIVAGNGISITNGNTIAIDTTVVATQQNLATEVTNRENADIALQGQIDAISASSDVVDIVGTYAELQNYDTSQLKDNDIIKVLQDSTQGNATTYYRWSTTTQSFTLIGQEGPYYTKAAADAQFVPQTRTINSKPLSANITLTASDVSALGQSDVVQTTGTSTSQVMSQNAVTTALASKLDSADVPAGFFDGAATVSPTAGTSLVIEDAIKLKSVELQGDTQQQTYTGKNLFDISKVLTNGTNLVNNDDGSITASLATGSVGSSPNTLGTYCPSLQVGDTVSLSFTTTGSINYVYLGAPASQAWVKNADKTITQDMLNAPVYWYGGTGNTAITYSDIQVELGTSVTSYEPYVGGVPSPNPDYPQTVSVVTGTQAVTVNGKNLFDRANAVENTILGWANANDVVENGSLSAHMYMSVTEGDTFASNYGMCVFFFGSNDNYLGCLLSGGTTIGKQTGTYVRTFSVPSGYGITKMKVEYRRNQGGNPSDMTSVTDIMLNVGSSVLPYEPYQGQSYTIDLGSIELAKIGSYQDYIYKTGNDWYVHKATGKVLLDGQESWTATGGGNGYRIEKSDIILTPASDLSPIVSNYFTITTFSDIYNARVDYGISNHNSNHWIVLRDKSWTSSTDVTTWLSTHNTTVYYALATATDTKITDATLISQLEEFASATLYRPISNLTVSGNLPAILGVTAYNSNLNGIIEVLASTASTLGNINSALNIINNGGN